MVSESLRRLLALEFTIARWLSVALALAVPYLALGVVWTVTNADRFGSPTRAGSIVRLAGSVVAWPALMVTDGCGA